MANTKKTFKKDNPALNFISVPEETTNSNESGKTYNTYEKLVAPEGYKLNPEFVETKSKRVQILAQPSVVEAMKTLANRKGISLNEAINEAIKKYLYDEYKNGGNENG